MNDVKTHITQMNERILSLDVLRGVAVMGILAMNIVNFALPQGDYAAPAGPMSNDAAGHISWLVGYLFFDGKMMGLFTLLFGASAMLLMDRAEVTGQNVAARHYSRTFWLFIFGLVHLLLIWRGDILVYYALCGLLLYFARHAPPYKLYVSGGLLLFGSYILMAAVAAEVLAIATRGGGDAVRLAEDLAIDFGYNEVGYSNELALYRGSYIQIVEYRIAELRHYAVSALELVPRLLGAMLIGAGLYRSGFLTGAMKSRSYLICAILMTVAALVISGLLAFWGFQAEFSPAVIFAISYAFPGSVQLLMAVGYAAFIIWMIKFVGGSQGWAQRIANVGRMSLSNYIGTSIVMTWIFYGYGLTFFGTVDRAELWLFVIAGCAIMLIASNIWLARFRQGPLEWLWRRLAAQTAII